ncbi:MAG: rod-binding protein [Acidobacteriota bacterium]
MTPPVSNTPAAAGTDGVPQPRDLKQAAAQFEALLLSQMLKSMRQAGDSGWLGTGEDESGSCMMELAEEQLAQALASQGGLGLANMVVKNLGPAKK